MKRISPTATLLSFTLLVLSSCHPNTERTSLEQLNLKGDVVSITDTVWTAIEKNGRPCKESMYAVTKIELNDDGQMTSQTEWDLSGGMVSHITQTWDSRYCQSSRKVYDEENKLVETYSDYQYEDDKVKRMLITDFKGSRKVVQDVFYTYNSEGRVAEMVFRIGDKIMKRNTFSYLDNLGSYIVTSIEGDNTLVETIYFNERMQVKSLTVDGESYYFEFDDQGNETRYISPWAIATYTYKYDPRGNWTEKVEYEQDLEDNSTSLTLITTRHIAYKD